MTARHMLRSVSLALIVAAFLVPAAVATPDGYVVRTGSALDAKSTIESRAGTQAPSFGNHSPDGHQPHLATSDGANRAPDNVVRDVPRGTFPLGSVEPRITDGGFDWADGIVGAVAALVLAILLAGFLAAARGRTLARA